MNMRRISVLFILLLKVNTLFSQNLFTIDSLIDFKNQINKSNPLDSIRLLSKKNKIVTLVEQTKDGRLLFYAYSVLGDINRNAGNYEKAITFYFKAFEFSKSANSLDVALDYDALAKIYMNKGEIGSMFESVGKSLSIKEKLKNEYEINRTNQILLKYYRSIGNYSEALRIAFNSLNYFISINDSLRIAQVYNSIGITYNTIENYNKALSYFKLSEVYYRKSKDKKGLSALLNNKGNVLLNQKRYQNALENFQKSLEIETELGNFDDILIRRNNIGLAYNRLGNYKPALYNFKFCLEKYKESGSLVKLASTYESLSQYYDLKGDADSLEYCLIKSYRLSDSLNIKKLQAKTALRLSLLYKAKNDPNKSLTYLMKYKEIDDSLFHSVSTQRITDEEFNFIRLKDYELQRVEKRNTIQKYIIVIGCLLILILATWIFLLMLRHKVKVKEKINKNLEEKVEYQKDELLVQGKELVSKTLQLGSNSSEVSHAIQQLKKSQAEFGIQGKQKIQKLILELEYSQNKDIWSEFELRFSKVNKDFYEKLLLRFPSLSINERRLAALVLLNFSTKEIATITKQTYRSVLVAKSRLRKKMNLSPAENLSNYLNELLHS